MKKIYILLSCLVGIIPIQAQQTLPREEVPAAVVNEFDKEHPSEKEIRWEKKGENYAANFEDKDLRYSALYSSAGTMLYLTAKITENELPMGIRAYLNKNYPDRIIADGKKITFADEAISYSVEIDWIFLIN